MKRLNSLLIWICICLCSWGTVFTFSSSHIGLRGAKVNASDVKFQNKQNVLHKHRFDTFPADGILRNQFRSKLSTEKRFNFKFYLNEMPKTPMAFYLSLIHI